MTARQVYEGVLIEMNKVQAPSLLLEDFNYLFNKAINQYINKRYNIYDINQQTTDDIRVLKASAVLKPVKSFTSGKSGGHSSGETPTYGEMTLEDGISGKNTSSPYGTVYDVTGMNSLYGATYEAYLPMDYLHLLSCICNFRVKKTFKCYDKNTFMQFAAQRLTSDAWSTIINNFYMRPSYKKPYYYIHNVNTKRDVPTSPHRSTNFFKLQGFSVKALDGTVLTGENLTQGGYDKIMGLNLLSKYTFTDTASGDISATTYVVHSNPLITVDVNGTKYGYYIGSGTPDGGAYYKAYQDGENVEGYEGLYYKGIDNQYYSRKELVAINTLTYVQSLADVGGYSTGQDMDSLDKDGKPTNGYTYGRYTNTEGDGTEGDYTASPTGVSNFPRSIVIGDSTSGFTAIDSVERPAAQRFGNASQVRLEIRYGKDDSLFELASVYVDYIKTPQFIRLTQEQLDLTEDTSQIMEFPDYVCQEIINELVHIVMENASDPRLQSHPAVSQSIANPAQGQAQQQG